jgi:hypothetical protein
MTLLHPSVVVSSSMENGRLNLTIWTKNMANNSVLVNLSDLAKNPLISTDLGSVLVGVASEYYVYIQS